jgi:riboflavin synthase
MFTGIIEETGRVASIELNAGTRRLEISAKEVLNHLHIGDSIAVSGVCLTVVDLAEASFSADLAAETWNCTSFSRIATGAVVNLELAMKADGRLGGHVVQGHVDGTGKFLGIFPVPGAQDFWLKIEVPIELEHFLVHKGSIAIEGISLTIAKLSGNVLTVAIIPHTCTMTNLATLKPGDAVNIETDVFAKYFAKWTKEEKANIEAPSYLSTPGTNSRYGIVVSKFNSFITDQLLNGALETLKLHGVPAENIKVVSVPGAYEIPIAAKLLAHSGRYDAVICLGCLIRGETLHYEVIANESSRGIGQSALETGIPHAFGVITCDTQQQAIDRAGLKAGNAGSNAAQAAVRMATLRKELAAEIGAAVGA